MIRWRCVCVWCLRVGAMEGGETRKISRFRARISEVSSRIDARGREAGGGSRGAGTDTGGSRMKCSTTCRRAAREDDCVSLLKACGTVEASRGSSSCSCCPPSPCLSVRPKHSFFLWRRSLATKRRAGGRGRRLCRTRAREMAGTQPPAREARPCARKGWSDRRGSEDRRVARGRLEAPCTSARSPGRGEEARAVRADDRLCERPSRRRAKRVPSGAPRARSPGSRRVAQVRRVTLETCVVAGRGALETCVVAGRGVGSSRSIIAHFCPGLWGSREPSCLSPS